MNWKILYHFVVADDLEIVGPSGSRRIMRAMDTKLKKNPLQFGTQLSGNLSGFHKLRIGDYRVVYQVKKKEIIVFVLGVGPRRDKEIYQSALKRI